MLQKLRMPQIQGIKGEAELRYSDPMTTKEMLHHTAFPPGKKQGDFLLIQNSTFSEFLNDFNFSLISPWLLNNIDLYPVFYATLGSLMIRYFRSLFLP